MSPPHHHSHHNHHHPNRHHHRASDNGTNKQTTRAMEKGEVNECRGGRREFAVLSALVNRKTLQVDFCSEGQGVKARRA